jgi:hypothetical protein
MGPLLLLRKLKCPSGEEARIIVRGMNRAGNTIVSQQHLLGINRINTIRHFTAARNDKETIVNTSQSSSGLIVDPYMRIKRPPSLLSSPLARISHMRKQTWKGVKSLYASSIVKKEFDTEPHKFIDEAEDMFVQFHRAYNAGNKSVIRELVTPELYQSLKPGFKGNWALSNTHDAPLEFLQINMQRRAGLPQCRLYYPDYKQNKNVGFAQLTVVISSIQKRSDKFIIPPRIKQLGNRGGSDNFANGVWKEEFDENTGLPYYWHTQTRQVQWDRPSTYVESLTKMYNTPNDCVKIKVESVGGEGGVVDDDATTAAPPAPTSSNDNINNNNNNMMNKKKKKKKKKKRRLRTIDDVADEHSETSSANESIIAEEEDDVVYNVDNILIFERPFHLHDSQWRIMKI